MQYDDQRLGYAVRAGPSVYRGGIMRLKRFAAILAAVTLTMLSTETAWSAPTTQATTASKTAISTARYVAIANEALANGGRLTDAQKAQLSTRPDLWDVVPTRAIPDYEMPGWTEDSAVTTTVGTTNAAAMSADATASALTTSTRSVDRYIVYEAGPFNTKVADYHFVVAWSYNGTQVVGTPSSYTYLKNACGGCQNGGIFTNSQYRNYNSRGVYAWTVPLTGKWQWCSSGCQYFYPQVRFGVYFNGTYNYTVLSTG
jgi:hypothetical protein